MCRVAVDSTILKRCGASNRLPFVGIYQKLVEWIRKEQKRHRAHSQMYIHVDRIHAFSFHDDCRKITPSGVDRRYFLSITHSNQFFSLFKLLFVNLSFSICVFLLSLLHSRSQKYAHTKLRIDWNVRICETEQTENTSIFFTWAKKVFRT